MNSDQLRQAEAEARYLAEKEDRFFGWTEIEGGQEEMTFTQACREKVIELERAYQTYRPEEP